MILPYSAISKCCLRLSFWISLIISFIHKAPFHSLFCFWKNPQWTLIHENSWKIICLQILLCFHSSFIEGKKTVYKSVHATWLLMCASGLVLQSSLQRSLIPFVVRRLTTLSSWLFLNTWLLWCGIFHFNRRAYDRDLNIQLSWKEENCQGFFFSQRSNCWFQFSYPQAIP